MKNKKRLMIIAVLLTFILGFFVSAYFLANKVTEIIKEKSQNIAGLSLDIKAYDINFTTGRIVLEGIEIYEAGKKGKDNLLASAKELLVVPSIKSLFKRMIYIKEVSLKEPVIQYICANSRNCNWNALDLSEFDDKEPKKDVEKRGTKKDGSRWKIVVDSVHVKNATLRYKDYSKNHSLELNKLNAGVKNIKSDSNPETLPSKVFLNAIIGDTNGSVDVTGNANLFAKGINFTINSSIKNVPIVYFSSFYVNEVPFKIERGILNIDTNADSKNSYLNSISAVFIDDLKVGGNPQGLLIDEFLANSKRQVKLDVKVNGNIEKGDLYFSTELTREIVKAILKTVGQINPLQPVETGKRILEGGIKRLFGK